METQTKINIGYAVAFLILSSYVGVNLVNDNGTELNPTHYCEAREIKTYCSGLTKYYSLPNGKCLNPKGNLLCRSGWEEIQIERQKGKREICTVKGCKAIND